MTILNKVATVFSIVALTSVATAAMAAQPTTETWDDVPAGVNGWVGNTTSSTVVHIAAGGNPDGFLQSRRAGTFDIGALIDADDSTDFTGDYAAAGITGASFELNLMAGDFTNAWLRFRSGPAVNGWRYEADIAAAVLGEWNSHSVTFDPTWDDATAIGAGWLQEDALSPSFADTLANVDTAEVRLAGTSTSLLVGIDNFSIVPEPGGFLLVGTAVLLLAGRKRS